ncbi:MAG TPA: SpoIIE family protein phosphatase [Vicinamibacterales bacterium]|nr:SpoIIE family protein phosphatase [Vicinamibacterales bacterium]
MSLRTRLILAFFALSVVPMAAVTYYSYTTNVEALRVAAQREADLLAGELGQRMQLVTAQLSERVGHLMDIAEVQAAADAASKQSMAMAANAKATTTPAITAPAVTEPGVYTISTQAALSDQIATSLGQTAMLLNNVRMSSVRPPPPPGARPDGRGAPPPRTFTVPVNPAAVPAVPSPDPEGSGRGRGRRRGPDNSRLPGQPAPVPVPPSVTQGPAVLDPAKPAPATAPAAAVAGTPLPAAPPAPAGPETPATPGAVTVTPTTDASGNLTIDIAPLRRSLFRQVLPPGKRYEDLTPEDRQRLAAEVNQRLLGIQQGIQIGAAELQKRADELEKEVAAKALADAEATPASGASAPRAPSAPTQPAAKPAAPRPAQAPELKRRASLSGNNIAVNVERNGQVVRSMNAELNLPNVLGLVFSTTQRDRGEVPFAVAKDGTVYARTEADKTRVAAFGDVARPGGPAVVSKGDWIIVTTEDKSGSGLRLGVARPVGDSLATLRRAAARNAGLGLLFITIALVGIVPLSAHMTRNLSALNEGVSRIAKGDYHARVPVKSNDEVGQLARAFNQMATDVERHEKTAVEQERIRRELELGRQIQTEMLPHGPLNLGLTQVQGVSVPAREVGGDFFNYFVLDDGQIALLMGDVSGKGVGAALLMANIQASLKIRLALGQNLAAVVDALDRDIESGSPGSVYATLFIGILDPASRVLRYVNAGHNPQYALRRTGGLERMHATGFPVGLIAGHGYSELSVQLAAGDLLFFYTDGCVEAENEQGEMFGVERLEPMLLDAVQSADPLQRIERAMAAYRGTSEPLDDATLMTVKVG